MQLSAGKFIQFDLVRGSLLWFPLIFILLQIKSYAQLPDIEVQNSRLLVEDYNITKKESNKGLLLTFLPKFSTQKVSIPALFNNQQLSQVQQSFKVTDGSWGQIDAGHIARFKNKSYFLSDTFMSSSFGDILHIITDTSSPNCFYIAKSRLASPNWSSSFINNYIEACYACALSDGTISIQKLNKIYLGSFKLNKSAYSSVPGWITFSNNGKSYFVNILNRGGQSGTGTDTSIHTFKLGKTGLTGKTASYISSLDGIKYYSVSANSKRVALTNTVPHLTRGAPKESRTKLKELYLYQLNDGYKIDLSPDTLRPYTYDTSLYSGLEFENAQLSPTGRYLYVIERVSSKAYMPMQIPNNSGGVNLFNWYSFSTRLLQLDLAGAGKPGFKPKVRVLKEWQKPTYSYRIFLHSVPVDGKLYFCEEETHYISNNRIDTTAIRFWQLDNIETDSLTFKSAKVVIDKMDFPVIFYNTETFNQNTWKQYPYQAFNEIECQGGKTYFWLNSTISYDSVIWVVNSGKYTTTPSDSVFKEYLAPGWHTITYYVYRNGYEDLLMKELYVKASGHKFDTLRTLPKTVYGCKENEVWLNPGKDTLAISYNWIDGTQGTVRKITESGIYIWQVFYQDSKCPRLDTVIVKITDWDNIKLTGSVQCDTTTAILKIENLQSQMLWQWQDGDSTSLTYTVSEPGKYCITIIDTLAKCSKQICTEVRLFRSTAPTWSNRDTSLCEGEILELKPDSGYILDCPEGTDYRNGNCIISKAGSYTFKYKKQTEPQDICNWKDATLNVKINSSENTTLCPQTTNCQWYIPNAFTPDDNNLNEQWFPVSTCDKSSYTVTIYNRWGGLVYEGKNIGWNGKLHNNVLAPEGIYFYKINTDQLDKKTKYFSGSVHLLR